jgi:uncharacterized protein (TIGR00369 family)
MAAVIKSFFGLSIPFLDLLGVQPEHLENGRAVLSLNVRPELTNSWEVAHGAVIMALLDVSMGMATRSVHEDSDGVVTVDMSVNFLQAAAGRLTAEGRVLRKGRSLVFCEGEVRDAGGELVAKAIGTFKLRGYRDRESSHSKRAER